MEFQDIIPFFIFMIWLFSLFGKKKKKAKADASPQKPSPLRSIIQTLAKQLKEQVEAARREQERTIRQTPEGDNRFRSQAADLPASETGKAIDIAFADTETREQDETVSVRKEVAKKGPVEQSGYRKDSLRPTASSTSLQQLRNAVVWSEILGKPVALRSDHLKRR